MCSGCRREHSLNFLGLSDERSKSYRTSTTKVIFVMALTAMMGACDEEKPKNILKEAIDVEGTCAEDHVGRRDDYAG